MKIIRKITLPPDTPDALYKAFIEMCEYDGVFDSCGFPDNKWVMVKFESEMDFRAWMLINNLG